MLADSPPHKRETNVYNILGTVVMGSETARDGSMTNGGTTKYGILWVTVQ